MKGLKLRNIVGLFFLVLCAASVLVAHVWKQNNYIRLSKGTVKLGKACGQLRNDIALLEVSVGGLKKRSRIESLAKSRFGLEYGNTPMLVYIEGSFAKTTSMESNDLEAGKVAWRINGL